MDVLSLRPPNITKTAACCYRPRTSKFCLYRPGEIPYRRSNARRNESALVNPTEPASSSIDLPCVTRRLRASPRRRSSTNAAGEVPNVFLNRLLKCRGRGVSARRAPRRKDLPPGGRSPRRRARKTGRGPELVLERLGILFLPPVSLQVDDELRSRKARCAARSFLDERQGKIDAGRDSRDV